MRHRKKINHLSRTSSHRKAMLSNMASSLILHKRIHTTTAKAKALRVYIEPLITKSKEDTTHSRRVVFSYLQDKEAVTELFREVSLKIADRHGGYTRIIKLPNRLGDNAEMCMMELVDYNENLLDTKPAKAKSTRRKRGATKKKADEKATIAPAVAAETAEVVDEDVTEQVVEEAVAETVTEEVVEEKASETEAVTEEIVEEKVADTEPVAEVKEEVVETEVKEEEKKKEVPEAKVEEEKPAEEEKKDDSKQESK